MAAGEKPIILFQPPESKSFGCAVGGDVVGYNTNMATSGIQPEYPIGSEEASNTLKVSEALARQGVEIRPPSGHPILFFGRLWREPRDVEHVQTWNIGSRESFDDQTT